MKLGSFVALSFVIGLCSIGNFAFAQKDFTDTTASPKVGKSAEADALFFDAVKAKMHDDDKQAMELFEKFIASKPNVPAAYYELSKLYSNDRKQEKAEEYIKKALKFDASNKWYKKEYASLLGERGAYSEAADIMAELVKSEPNDAEYPLLTAEFYERAKKYEDAIKYLDKAIVRSGPDEEILMRKIQLYLQLNDVEHAAEVVSELISKDPRNGKYYKVLGEIYDNNKMPEKAGEVLDHAQKLIPSDPSVQLGMAEHYLKTGDTNSYKIFVKKAIVNKEFDAELQLKLLEAYLQNLSTDSDAKNEGMPIILQLVDQHPNDADILSFYGDFLESDNQKDKAIEIFKKSLEVNSSKFNVWLKLLQNFTDKKDADSLIKYSEKTIRLFPNQSLANYYNGIGHLNKKEYPAAIKSINRAIDLQPESKPEFLAAMYSTLGDIYNTTKQYELSDNAYNKSLHFDPNDATVLNNYSYYLSERGKRLDEAESMSKKSLQIRPGEATFLDTYGWILYKKGDIQGAKDYIEQAVKKYGDKADATLYDHLGNIYYKLNEKEKAVEYWKISKEKGGENPQLDKKISEGKLYE